MLKLKSWRAILLLPLLSAFASVGLPAQTFKTLTTFSISNGADPVAGLVQGADGNFYGTTWQGGASGYYGEVFKMTPQGALTVLHSFEGSDGGFPTAALVLGTDGEFYGTTGNGGAGAYCTETNGCGTVFKIKISAGVATLTTLYSFCSQPNCADGFPPYAGLVEGTDGNLYGSTTAGGNGSNCASFQPQGCGTIFKITREGQLTTLHVFNFTDGYQPAGTLVQGTDGNYYGTTTEGVAFGNTCGLGCGTVFKMTKGGTLTTLHVFEGPDGAFPEGALLQDTLGNFLGTTSAGGAYDDCGPEKFWCGTIFEITSTGTFTSVFSFDGADGADPTAGLIQAPDGNFYGTTVGGGNGAACDNGGYGCGTAFRITPSGALATLYSFCSQENCDDGASPEGGVLQATNGTFYGTATAGGASEFGTVFSLAVGLKPFIETNPTSGAVATKVTILGNKLTGTNSVTFNGTAATFTVKSSTEITATVPSGATTGFVQVKPASGTTLTSNVKFRVP